MLSPVVIPPGLVTGQRMSVDEFLCRWEALPDLKSAELIDGIVHVPSPLSRDYGSLDSLIIWWLAYYVQATPGCRSGNNSTWLMLDSSPQPDAFLQILPSHGGQSGDEARYCAGAAFWDNDGAKMLAALNAGLSAEDHQRFVERLGRVHTH